MLFFLCSGITELVLRTSGTSFRIGVQFLEQGVSVLRGPLLWNIASASLDVQWQGQAGYVPTPLEAIITDSNFGSLTPFKCV